MPTLDVTWKLAPGILAAGVAYLLLVATGMAPRPVGHPAIDTAPHDANWAFVGALFAAVFGGLMTFTRPRTLAAATAAGVLLGLIITVIR